MNDMIKREELLQNAYLTKPNNSKFWYYRFRYEKTKHSTKCKIKSDAEDFVIGLLLGEIKRQNSQTLNDFAIDFFNYDNSPWIARQKEKGKRFSKSHAKDRCWALDNYILPHFGQRVISSITPVEIEEFLLNLQLSNQSKNHILFTLRTVLKEAVRQSVINNNPAANVEPFAANPKIRDIYAAEEFQKMFPEKLEDFNNVWKDPKVGLLCFLALTTGIRHGEARALKWKDIIDNKNMIQITKSVKKDNTLGPTKNGKPRVVFLINRVRPILDFIYNQTDYKSPENFIFTLSGNKPFWTNHTYKYLNKALKSVEINKNTRKIDVHSFRHTNVTIIRKHGLDEGTLQRLIGHNVKSITDIYDHRELHDTHAFLIPYKQNIENIWDIEFSQEENNNTIESVS